MYPIKVMSGAPQVHRVERVEPADWELETDPAPCSWLFRRFGNVVCVADGDALSIEHFVKLVARQAKSELDWGYKDGRAHILHLGLRASRERAVQALNDLEPHLKGRILHLAHPPAVT